MSKNMWFLQGEVCCASSRVFVQEGIYDQVEKKLVEKAKAWIVGDPFDPKTQQGPQVRSICVGRAKAFNFSQSTNHTCNSF
jgi:acyl-CoA reductase-like NAD-dependent aldehyde dehydrogenase